MHRHLIAAAIAVCLSGCIKLEMPDDMVSDTIDAIKNSDDDKSEDDGTARFSHSIVGPADAEQSALKQQCLEELESRAEDLLARSPIDFTLISERVTISGDKAIATCTVSLN